MPVYVKRLVARTALPVALCLLAACASHGQGTAAKGAKAEDVVVVRSNNPLDYRFDMQQQGRQMTADEFDAWMKARGIRIAKGPPAKKPAAAAVRKNAR